MKLLLDACMPVEWAGFLRQHGHECVTWIDVGPPNAPDPEIMAWALRNSCVVLTNDLDYGKLLAFSKATQPCVIQFRAQDIRPAALGQTVLAALQQYAILLTDEEGDGALITVEEDRVRCRILPIE